MEDRIFKKAPEPIWGFYLSLLHTFIRTRLFSKLLHFLLDNHTGILDNSPDQTCLTES